MIPQASETFPATAPLPDDIAMAPAQPSPPGYAELAQAAFTFAKDKAVDLGIAGVLTALEPEIVLPVAVTAGVAQIVRQHPLPPELGEQIRTLRLPDAARSLGQYTCAHAQELVTDKNNIFRRTVVTAIENEVKLFKSARFAASLISKAL